MITWAPTIMLIYSGIALLVAGQIMRTQRTNQYFRHSPEEHKILVSLVVGIPWVFWLLLTIAGILLFLVLIALNVDDKN